MDDEQLNALEARVRKVNDWASPSVVGHMVSEDALLVITDLRTARRQAAQALDGLEAAWGLIANAYDGNWDSAPAEWKTAAERWREEVWHRALQRARGVCADDAHEWSELRYTERGVFTGETCRTCRTCGVTLVMPA